MKIRLLALLLVSGCASLDHAACRQADWYDLGFRDAIFGMQRQDDVYASQCETGGTKVDVARYAQGWKEGKWEADSRRSESAD
jgi:Protein of unknown function (DUF2799)